VLLLVVAGTFPDRASAHGESSRRVAVTLEPLPARLARVKIQLQHTLGDQLLIENRSGTPLEVLDDHGVVFLRIGPAGAEANLTAPAWYETVSVDDVPIPPPAHAGATPVWARVATNPAWGWFDRRLRCGAADTHSADGEPGRPPPPGRWTIPLRFGGVPVALHGRCRLAPPPTGVFTPRLTSPEQPFPGVRVQLIAGRVPALYLQNTGDEPVVVLGASGEPFLRIGPGGTSANVRSPTWQRTGKAEVTTTAPPIDAKAAPAWQTQSSTPSYAWIEFRAAPPANEPPRAAARTRATVRRWEVPLRRGAAHAVVSGAIEWMPIAEVPPRS
jgi:hypothetical protein